jgi:hypothetical protein
MKKNDVQDRTGKVKWLKMAAILSIEVWEKDLKETQFQATGIK